MQPSTELPTTIDALKTRLFWLDKAMEACSDRAFEILFVQYKAVSAKLDSLRLADVSSAPQL